MAENVRSGNGVVSRTGGHNIGYRGGFHSAAGKLKKRDNKARMRRRVVIQAFLVAILLTSTCSLWAQTAKRPVRRPQAQQPVANSSAEADQKPTEAEKTPIPGQPRRLILRDGSYQDTIRWERRGDRVRYLSSERFAWEEVPYSLIDWQATEQYAKSGGEKPASAEAAAADAEEEAERKEEEAKSPEVKPGLRLPTQGGVYLLDYWRDTPQLIELVQNGSDINKNMGRNILRAAINPLAKAKQSIELKGSHARVQSHVPQPAIYLDIDLDSDPKSGAPATDLSNHFRIVKVTPKKDARVVGNIEVAVYGKVTQKADYVPTTSAAYTSQWIKVTPSQPLEPGEYALVEMLGKDVNLYVWDFGVNPAAPENQAAWKPAPVKDTSTGTKDTPVLNKRPPKDQPPPEQ